MTTQQQVLTRTILALGGTWDTRRTVTALVAAEHEFADQRAAEKRARRILRDLAASGVLVKASPDRAEYRAADQ
ncbi:hypothetical protein [Peterkaempfera bronchialis]|uniref:hypothetical protein n=1 Tax=Peterkaempfera bronchialis TaxID=2126346 RepID=UPI003C3004ED